MFTHSFISFSITYGSVKKPNDKKSKENEQLSAGLSKKQHIKCAELSLSHWKVVHDGENPVLVSFQA